MSIPRQLNLLLLATGFLTRLPLPFSLDFNPEAQHASTRYFTLVGAIIGLIMALVYWASSLVLPATIAVLLVLIANLLLTGCFHQDGLADMADGFGGAFEARRKLDIMKDSRLGTYGSCALIASLALHYGLLLELEIVMTALILGQGVSRTVAASLMVDTPYAADPDKSKSKAHSLSRTDLTVLLVSAAALLLLTSLGIAITLVLVLTAFRWLFRRYCIAQIGGYTGDCLGAAQQISEILIYLVLLIAQGQAL